MNKDKFKKKKKFATFFKQQQGKMGEEETEWSFLHFLLFASPIFFFSCLNWERHLPYEAS